MSEGSKAPKTLADVSHLFFSAADERTKEAGDEGPARAAGRRPADPAQSAGRSGARDREPWRRTRVFVITGGNDGPGASTVAVNFAQAFAARGRVGLFDAGAAAPNARFYLGLPSDGYLTEAVGGEAAAASVEDSGVIVIDCATGPQAASGLFDAGEIVRVDVAGEGRQELDYAVVDLPVERADWVAPVAGDTGLFVVVAQPGRGSFDQTFAVLSILSRRCGLDSAGVLVNKVPDYRYAIEFHAKIREAARRLLSMEAHFMGGVVFEEGLGSLQRETGAIVRSRSDAASALALRESAWNAMGFGREEERPTIVPVRTAEMETSRETTD